MKRTIWITLVLLLMCVLVLSACDSGDTPPSNDVTNQTGSNNGGGNNEVDDPATTCQHTSSDWITDKAATCKEEGSKYKECTKCEEILETASIDKLTTHTPGEAVTENYVDSDCETEGSYNLVVYCSVCNEKLSTEAKTVEKKPHSSSNWIIDKAATCKEAGSKHKECTKCEEVLETASIDKLTTHTPGEAVTENYVDSDCETEGSYNLVVYCSVCNEKLSTEAKTVEKKPHSSSNWIIDKAATCKEAGSKHKECTKCEEVLETASIDKLTTHTTVIDSRVEPTFTSTGLTEGSHCGVCGVVIVAQDVIPMIPSKTTLTTTTLALDGRNISGSFSYATEIFNFANDIIVTNNSPWVVSTDSYGMQTVATKIVPLSEGNNIFYIHVTNPDQTVSTYTVNIYRNHLYTVSFNTNGGTGVSTQYVEEGYLAQQPTTTRAGYTFSSWDFDFSSPIRSNITINANWNANENTPYKLEYYRQNLDRNGYELIVSETEVLAGKTDTTAYAKQKIFEHFTLNRNMSALSGNIDGDGSLVLKLYYTRDTYTISLNKNNTKAGTITSDGTYAYDKSITITAMTNAGYTFLGWYEGETKISDNLSYTFNVDHSAIITAKWETNVYNITYELNGGANNEHNVATYTVETPTIVLGSPERTGYAFNGWFVDEAFTTQATAITLGSYGEKKFYAKWTPVVYKITYDHNYQGSTTDSAYTITNNSTYPWNESNGVLISSNKGNSTSATYKIVANTEITVSFKYKVSSESNYDFLTIVQNGTQVAKISGSTAYESYSTTLYAGEYITFTYSKDSSQYSENDCAYISDLVCRQTRYTTEAEYNIETPTFDLTIPERAGYIFKGWFTEDSFENQVSSIYIGSHGDKMFYAKWEARTDTPYKVEYYLQNLEDDNYSIILSETEEKAGKTDTVASAIEKSFLHFTFNPTVSVMNGNIDGEGALVLKVYYTRDRYTISNGNTNYGCLNNSGTYKYGTVLNVFADENIGYKFLGWYNGDILVSEDNNYIFTIDKDIEARFEVKEEMENFKFTSTLTTCAITGLKDKSITELIVPDYVTSIGWGAFSGCSSLEKITIPFVGLSFENAFNANDQRHFGCIFGEKSYANSVATKSNYANPFYLPANLKEVCVTGGGIFKNAFTNCVKLETIVIGSEITSISDGAFKGCSALENLHIIDLVAWNNICFDTNEANPLHITNNLYINGEKIETLVIPDEISEISNYAFCGFKGTSISISSSVTHIGADAFYNCDNLINVYISDLSAWCNIGFDSCYSNPLYYAHNFHLNNVLIDNLVIPSSVTILGDYVFYGYNGSNISISSNVKSIGNYTFSNCNNINTVVLSDNIIHIGDYAFSNCCKLISITVGNGMIDIGESAFVDCYKLIEVVNNSRLDISAESDKWGYIGYYAKEVHAGESKIKNIENYLFFAYDNVAYLLDYVGEDSDLVLPKDYDGYYEIYKYAFYNRDDLTSIIIPDNVTIIGDNAFCNCSGLLSVEIGKGITQITKSSFDGCSSIRTLTLPFIPGNYLGYMFGANSYSMNSTYIPNELSTVIVTSATKIPSYAFYECSTLRNVTIGDSVTEIESAAFYKCSNLVKLTIPFVGANRDSAAHFGAIFGVSNSFEGINPIHYHTSTFIDYGDGIYRTRWTTYAIPTTLIYLTITDDSSISENAFFNCTNLVSITLPNILNNITSSAFNGCGKLVEIYNPSTTNINHNVLDLHLSLQNKSNLFVDEQGYVFYESTNTYLLGYIGNSTSLELPSTFNGNPYAIYSCAFFDNDKIVSVIIPEGITIVGASAFYDCDKLTSVNIGDSVTKIGNYAFYHCSSLNQCTLGSSITDIGNYAFKSCSYLREIMIGDNVTRIGSGAFGSCTKLSLLTIGGNVKSIEDNAFAGCESLTYVVLPESVISIGSKVFYFCDNLTTVIFRGNLTIIPECTFWGCYKLTTVNIPKTVTKICDSVFMYCDDLSYVCYEGSSEQWSSVSVGQKNNGELYGYWQGGYYVSGPIHFYSEEQPTDSGQYWYYSEEYNIVIW